mgnify:CR=1 FL=1
MDWEGAMAQCIGGDGHGGGTVETAVAAEACWLGQWPRRVVETTVVARALAAHHGLSDGGRGAVAAA